MAAVSVAATPILRRELTGERLRWARIAVALLLVPLAIVFVRWELRWVDARTAAASAFPEYANSLALQVLVDVSILASLVSVVLWWILAGLVFARRSGDVFGLALTVAFFSFGPCLTDSSRFTPLTRAEELPLGTALLFIANAWTLPWVFAFPNGRLIPRWAPVVIAVWIGWYVVRSITTAVEPEGALLFVWMAMPVFAVGTFVYRYFRSRDVVERAQIKWIAFAGIFFLIPWAVLNIVGGVTTSLFTGEAGLFYSTTTGIIAAIAQVALPLSIAAAIFRSGLLDIDVLLNRTITYGFLTAVLVAAFIVMSTAADRLIVAVTGHSTDLGVLAAVVPLALVFMPLRSAMLRFAGRFLSGTRVLTVLFLDIAGSTELAVQIGDLAWRRTLEEFRSTVRRQLQRYRGEEIDTAGDGFFVTFDGPARAIRCAETIAVAVRPLGLEVRVGLHVGEVQVYAEGVSGVAVHFASRLMALARPGEIVVSQPLKDLVAGSNIALEDRGEHQLKGLPGAWRVFKVTA